MNKLKYISITVISLMLITTNVFACYCGGYFPKNGAVQLINEDINVYTGRADLYKKYKTTDIKENDMSLLLTEKNGFLTVNIYNRKCSKLDIYLQSSVAYFRRTDANTPFQQIKDEFETTPFINKIAKLTIKPEVYEINIGRFTINGKNPKLFAVASCNKESKIIVSKELTLKPQLYCGMFGYFYIDNPNEIERLNKEAVESWNEIMQFQGVHDCKV